MKISAKADYACIAVLDLSRYDKEGEPVSIDEIADRQGISRTFLVHIMKDLKNADIVESVRGPGGGYRLARSPESISVASVIEAIEGPMIDLKCMRPAEEEGCKLEPHCEIQSIWDVIKYRIVSVLEGLSFREVRQMAKAFKGDTEEETSEPAFMAEALSGDA